MEDAQRFIEINNVTKVFAKKDSSRGESSLVLEDISLHIAQGSFTTIVGRSGIGKTTLLRILGGLDKKFSGEIKVGGKKLDASLQKYIGFVFQASALLPWKNVEENIYFFCGLLGKKCDAAKIIREVDLAGFEKYYPDQLSGGMQKRVALARALAIHPKILLLDEPFGSLDELNRQKMNQLLLKLWQEFSITTVLVTHNIEEAILLSDKIIVLAGAPAKVKNIYSTKEITRPRNNDTRKNPVYLALLDNIYADLDL